MAHKKENSLFERAADFIEDSNSDDEAVNLVYELYQLVLALANENGSLELENSMLERQLTIAENYIMSMDMGNGSTSHLPS